MTAPAPELDPLSKVIQHNCEVKGEAYALTSRPWFLNKSLNERTASILLQLLHDSEKRTFLFAAMAAMKVISLINARNTFGEIRLFYMEELAAAKEAIPNLDDISIASNYVTFKLAYIGEGSDLSAEIKIGDMSLFFQQGKEASIELEFGVPVILIVFIGNSEMGRVVLDLEPKVFTINQLLNQPTFQMNKDPVIAGIRVCLDVSMALTPQTKASLLRSKIVQLEDDLMELGSCEEDLADLLNALDIKVEGSTVKSTLVKSKEQKKPKEPKMERDCECCHVF
mmetsp:Transcript_3862/g.8136  ORF Transcript_3862/g.8136 Transcript_3862/m.8136 type:complete len:282 (-) Transcript_3862:1358-2203(-)